MAVKLNNSGYEYAQELIAQGNFVYDERDAWSEDQPSAAEENEFIRTHGLPEFGKWHLGIDDEHPENTKGRYKFPYGDFERVHRCGVLSAGEQGRAVQALRHRARSRPSAWNDREHEDRADKAGEAATITKHKSG